MIENENLNFKNIILIASSTGGVEALEKILTPLSADTPPIVIVQHLPANFTNIFAQRLNSICNVTVKEGKHGDLLEKGLVLIAPGNVHSSLVKIGPYVRLKCEKGEKIHGVMPSADVLFSSAAKVLKGNCVGVILTGMGNDGAKGLLNIKKAGGKTIGQNKESSVVYGMPKAAYKIKALTDVANLDDISSLMLKYALS